MRQNEAQIDDIQPRPPLWRGRVLASRRVRPRAMALVLLAGLALAGCGAGTSHRDPPKSVPNQPKPSLNQPKPVALAVPGTQAVVARVGSRTLTGAMLTHLIDLGVALEPAAIRAPLVPPSFSKCITAIEAQERLKGTSVSAASAERTCQARYEEDRQAAIRRWISGEWTIHGAEEYGVAVSDQAVREGYIREAHEESKSVSEFEKQMVEAGETEADRLRAIRVTRSGERIREKIERIANHITQADLRHYYETHLRSYTVPEKRDLEIMRFKTKSEAEKAKREIAAGRTFASLAKASTLPQPIFSKDGLVRGLAPGVYSERPLDRAIFRSRPNVLGGPVKIVLGWYLFEVKRTHQGRRKAFGEVATSIRRMLPKLRTEQMLTAFTVPWRKKWRAKTDCARGYVIRKCKQFKEPPGTQPEDPYTLA
jgi:foldase protein PrsA